MFEGITNVKLIFLTGTELEYDFLTNVGIDKAFIEETI
jgi:hypothetical protein